MERCPHKRLTQTCLWVSRRVWQRRGWAVACCRAAGSECSSVGMGPFEGGCHYHHYLCHSLAPGNNSEGTQPCPSTENWIKDLLSVAPPSKQDPVSPSVSLSHQEASIGPLPSPSESRYTENHNHRKLTNLITWTTALSNAMNLWAMLCGPPKLDGSWWRGLTKCGPLEKGRGNQYFCLRTPWTVWKGKKIGHWKMNSPGH